MDTLPGTPRAVNPAASCELLAPAGNPDSAYAAFHYGADAVYLGLKRFSARAEADNFDLADLGEITSFAHAQVPRRKVYTALNTLILNGEIPELTDTLAAVADAGVDALIVQDMGVAALARKHFPALRLHASTQLTIHNLNGLAMLQRLGFRRVTLARELTLDEIRRISREAGIEVEVFVHGALCYSYSGLCLYSSMLRGKSGNRGRCAYPCRDAFGPAEAMRSAAAKRRRFIFSMKDLSASAEIPGLVSAGVSALKIEGRMKSPLYTAATTAFYRGLLDQTLSPAEIRERMFHIQAIFSRPWTPLYLRSRQNRDVADTETVGHRGAPVGQVLSLARRHGRPTLVLRLSRAIERHDGLQLDLEGRGQPFGFPVDSLGVADGRSRTRTVFRAEAGSEVEVAIPEWDSRIRPGAPVYGSSSQEVKRLYRWSRPKPGLFAIRHPLRLTLDVEPRELTVHASIPASPPATRIEESVRVEGDFAPCKDPRAMETTVRVAFDKLGDTAYKTESIRLNNPRALFVPVSVLNRLRRQMIRQLDDQRQRQRVLRLGELRQALSPPPRRQRPSAEDIRWSVKVDDASWLAPFGVEDWTGVDDVVLALGRKPLHVLKDELIHLALAAGRDRIRLALPLISRVEEETTLARTVRALRADGWQKWEAAHLSNWPHLSDRGPFPPDVDLSADWSVYALNRIAAQAILDLGASRITLSPEDGMENMKELLGEFGEKITVVVYQDTPLFVSDTCGFFNLDGRCKKATDGCADIRLMSGHKESLIMTGRHCRTVVVNERPFCIQPYLHDLAVGGNLRVRADFLYRRYTPSEVLSTWRALRNGRFNRPFHSGHFLQGLR